MVKSIVLNLLGACFLLLLIDGCVYRDPYVRLSGGYVISAISPSSPCELYLRPKPEADWSAVPNLGDNKNSIMLFHHKDDSMMTVDSLDEIKTRFGFDNVNMSQVAPRIENVTGYTFNKRFVAGRHPKEYFLLDVTSHGLRSWDARLDWEQAVTEVGLSPNRLSDPKGRLHQWRHPVTFPVYAGLLLVAAVRPILKRKHKPNHGDGFRAHK